MEKSWNFVGQPQWEPWALISVQWPLVPLQSDFQPSLLIFVELLPGTLPLLWFVATENFALWSPMITAENFSAVVVPDHCKVVINTTNESQWWPWLINSQSWFPSPWLSCAEIRGDQDGSYFGGGHSHITTTEKTTELCGPPSSRNQGDRNCLNLLPVYTWAIQLQSSLQSSRSGGVWYAADVT